MKMKKFLKNHKKVFTLLRWILSVEKQSMLKMGDVWTLSFFILFSRDHKKIICYHGITDHFDVITE